MKPGEKLGPYEILALIGVGGMGEVYRAKDTKLKREVALKVLPDAFAADPERMARFQREAEVLASLNHPNIAQIYGVEDRALVMELVEGESPSGPLPFEEAWKIALQIAGALEYAHEKAIVHRDLKPANVKVTPDGVVKLLDFGLAKALSTQDAETQVENRLTDSPTLTIGATVAGVILGTAAYMAPEQAKGKSVDKRADIWAFGVVLHELLTGEQLFAGDDVADTLAHVLTRQPEWEKVPVRARRLLQECLKKDPRERLRDIGDAGRFLSDGAAPAPAAAPSKISWGVAAGLSFIAAAFSWMHFRQQPPAQPGVVRFTITPPEKSSFTTASSPVISPDGRHVVFNATAGSINQLWIRAIDSLESRPVPGSEGAIGTPFWSNDSRWITFSTPGKLKKADAAGGVAQTVCDVSEAAYGGFWTADNRIVFGGPPGILQVPTQGGASSTVMVPDREHGERGLVEPSPLPDRVHFLYTRYAPGSDTTGIYVGALNRKPEQQERKRLLPDLSFAKYFADPASHNGFVLFARGTTLMAQPFDPSRNELTGEAAPIQEQLVVTEGITAGFSVSSTGTLIFRTGQSSDRVLSWYDRQGRTTGNAWVPAQYTEAVLSPDDSRVAAVRGELNGNTDIYVYEFAGGRSIRLTSTAENHANPVWSARGDKILYSIRGSRVALLEKPADGAGDEEVIVKFDRTPSPSSWSRDGRVLMMTMPDPKTRRDLGVVRMDGEHQATKFLQTEFNESSGQFSPEPGGPKFVAYVSDESGKDEVYVTTFPDRSRRKWPISTNGGIQPRWRRDGKELLYFTPDGKLMSVDITLSPSFKPGPPRQILQAPIFLGGSYAIQSRWDVTSDGQRFLVVASPNETSSPLSVVLNWQSLLK